MYKKVVIFFVMLSLLIPTPLFALEENQSSDLESDGIVIENNITSESDDVVEEGNGESSDSDIVNTDLNNNEVGSSDEEPEGEVKEEEVIEPELQPAQVVNCTIDSTGPSSCKVTWEKVDVSKITIRYSYKDFDKTLTSSSSNYSITGIPFGETVEIVLSTDEEHESVTLKCNPSDDYKPVKVTTRDGAVVYNPNYSKASQYAYGFDVMTKKGTLVYSNYYDRTSSAINGPGTYDVKIAFKGSYANYKALTYKLKIVPNEPSLTYFDVFQYSNKIDLYVYTRYDDCDKIIVKLYTDKACKNLVKTHSVKKGKEKKSIRLDFTGLKANTQYYAKAYTQKTVKSVTYNSPSVIEPIHTTRVLKYSRGQADVKKVIALMKKNKTFTYDFGKYVSYDDVWDLLHNVSTDYPQYSLRYNDNYTINSSRVKVKFVYSSKNAVKAKKLEKVINSIVKGAKKKKGTKAKVRYINNRMCKISKYDYDTYRKTKKYNADAYTAYGCLVRGKAVCSGYTAAFHAIAVQMNFTDGYGHGKNHIWNKVKIGKTWYHVDVTWNDCTHSTKWLLKKKHAKG